MDLLFIFHLFAIVFHHAKLLCTYKASKYGNNRVMKKRLTLTLILLSLLIVFTLMLCSCNTAPSQEEISRQCVRIHIRANSSSSEDQAIKLKVRDGITEYLQTRLENCQSKSDALTVLAKEEQNLVNIANNALYLGGFDYKASIVLKNEYFPVKQYDDYTFPEGYYDALIIYLGDGAGENWWCVAFPPLCFVPDTQNGEKITYKSWVKEWLDKTFG